MKRTKTLASLRLALIVLLVLSGCAAAPEQRSLPRQVPDALPEDPAWLTGVPFGHTRYDNDSLANLFTRLAHDLEWGGRRPALVRLQQPVSVGMTGCCTSDYAGFVDGFLAQMRAQTGIDIRRSTKPHNLLIRLVPGNDFRDAIPAHLCVVAPGRLPWSQFRQNPERYGTRSFERRREVGAMSVYIPDTAQPHRIRLCLIEEITQALGLANDLNGLGPSIFNDDGAHIWPTRLDYLLMRVLYAPELRPGMNRSETRSAARHVLNRLNPQGTGAPALNLQPRRAMAEWNRHLSEAFNRDRYRASRRDSAYAALEIARSRVPNSSYHCRSLYALLDFVRDPQDRLEHLNRAARICGSAHGPDDPRLDLIALARARVLYNLGRISEAWGTSEPLAPRLAAHGQAERLVALHALQAASLKAIQQPESSAHARAKAIAWGKYALGRNHPDVLRLAGTTGQ